MRKDAVDPIAARITARSSKSDVAALQRTLRFLSAYKGRTDGIFSETLKNSIMAVQKSHALIADAKSRGAGTVGPKTHAVILDLWKQKHIALLSDKLMVAHRIETLLAESGLSPDRQLSKGHNGIAVRALQRFLANAGHFPASRINGNFGDMTQAAVLAYQKAEGIVTSSKDKGAGNVGPSTLSRIKMDLEQSVLKVVRANGWEAAQKIL